MTNCYYQFEIEKEARKLYAFRTPWGIYRYKRMVMGTSPASSEVQKRIRSIINKCIMQDSDGEKGRSLLLWKLRGVLLVTESLSHMIHLNPLGYMLTLAQLGLKLPYVSNMN